MAATVVDNVKIKVLSTGTGALILGPAVDGYRGSEALINGNIYNYAIRVGGVYEIGQGTYLSASGSLTRSVKYSSNGDAVVTLPPNCEVSFVALAADLNGTGLSAEAIAAANAAINASAQAQDALAEIEAVSGPVAALLTDDGASLVLTQSGLSVEESLADRVKAPELAASSGAELVGFNVGDAGGVARRVQDKLRESRSVFDFMTLAQRAAVLSRSAAYDLTSAIQAAINAIGLAGGGDLLFPAGLYPITENLPVDYSGVRLRGEWRWGTLIRQDTLNAKCVTFSGMFNGLSGLSFIYNGTPLVGALAIEVAGSYCTLSDFVVRSC